MKTSAYKNLRIAFWVLAVVLGAGQAWISRFDLVNDTVSYLDMGDYFIHGHMAALINGIWSPLYALLLGITGFVVQPTIYREYPAVHFLLFLFFLFTLACFDYLLSNLVDLRRMYDPKTAGSDPEGAWLAIAFVCFLWSTLDLIGVYETNPDMLVAAFFFLACALLTKIAAGNGTWRVFLLFGAVLGLSYLTKAVMLPVSLVLLASAAAIARKHAFRVLIAFVAFVGVASPYVAALSIERGRLTFGDSGGYNYAVHIDGVPRHHWQGERPVDGVPAHPTREISVAPLAFEFRGPIPGTYPVWYDPMYWYAGVKTHFQPHFQLRAIGRNLLGEFNTFFYALNCLLFAGVVFSFAASRNKRGIVHNLMRLWFLVLPSVLTCALYSLVHFETRYIGGFFSVTGLAVLSAVVWADNNENRNLFAGIASVLLLFLVFSVAYPIWHVSRPWVPTKGSYEDVAYGAAEMGLRPGDQIASLNFSNLGTAMWARLARLQIVAEMYYWPGGAEGSNSSFWSLDQETQDRLLKRFSQTGAKAIVSSDAPTGATASQWRRIGKTGWYLLWFNQSLPPGTASAPGATNR